MAWQFRLITQLTQRLNVASLTPSRLASLSLAEINVLPLYYGQQPFPLSLFFEVTQLSHPAMILFRDSCSYLDGIGTALSSGTIWVKGEAGAYLGQGLCGGEIVVEGNVGVYAGNGMKAGKIQIYGQVGDYLGAARPGETFGLQGGNIRVAGHAGHSVGERMRRGWIEIGGNVGNYCGVYMVAGNIVVGGKVGKCLGLNMRRGTILLATPPDSLLPTFNASGQHGLLFLKLLDLPAPFSNTQRVHRWTGDLACQGQGEILVLQ